MEFISQNKLNEFTEKFKHLIEQIIESECREQVSSKKRLFKVQNQTFNILFREIGIKNML